MQKTVSSIRSGAAVLYRERLSPSLWVIVSAAVAAPMAALVVAPIDTTLALVAGAVVGVAIVAFLIAGSPTVAISDGVLTAGRAHIDVAFTGEVVVLTGEEARHARGPGLQPRSWHVIRGGIDGIVIVAITDPDDPAPSWVISTRTPDRLAAALRRAQATPRTPSR
nr:DUF3093 domain-containing protein [Microbacterium sp.]